MAVEIYVESFNKDKTVGMTNNQAMLLENADRIKIINVEFKEDIQALVFELGRYVGLIIKDRDGRPGMIFFDFEKKREKALHATLALSDGMKDVFMKNFEAVTNNYEKNYDLVEFSI
jgi:hypothetical protein